MEKILIYRLKYVALLSKLHNTFRAALCENRLQGVYNKCRSISGSTSTQSDTALQCSPIFHRIKDNYVKQCPLGSLSMVVHACLFPQEYLLMLVFAEHR